MSTGAGQITMFALNNETVRKKGHPTPQKPLSSRLPSTPLFSKVDNPILLFTHLLGSVHELELDVEVLGIDFKFQGSNLGNTWALIGTTEFRTLFNNKLSRHDVRF
jgi:hypothetical protein